MRKPLRILSRLHPTRTVVDLCDVRETATSANSMNVDLKLRRAREATITFDGKRGVPADDEWAHAFAALFTILGAACCNSGRRYRLIDLNDGTEFTLGLESQPATADGK